jgi:hypothetical protein
MRQSAGNKRSPRLGWNARLKPFRDRKAIGWILGLLLVACALATVGAAILVWTSSMTLDQRIAGLGATFTVGAFTLAVLGAAVALLAYRLAIQRPNLVVHITTPDLEGQTIRVGLGRPDGAGERHIFLLPGYRRHGDSLPVHISVENTSDWSARNVAVRVDFQGIRGVTQSQDWRIAAYHPHVTNEVIALQWEGGADYAIHGHWSRELPDLYLNNALVEAPGENCALVVDVVAEGFREAWRFPVQTEPQVEMLDRQHGAVVGYCGYPGSGVPQLLVFAVPLTAGVVPRMTETVVGHFLRWFWIDGLEPGQYHIIAYRRDQLGHRGAYSVGARDDDLTAMMDHTLVTVEVKAGEVVQGIRITDWYAMDRVPPPPPEAISYGAGGSITTYSIPGPTSA